MKYLIIGLLVLSLLLTGCGEITIDRPPIPDLGEEYLGTINGGGGLTSSAVYRFIDEEYNVLCYVTSDYKKGGISCIPLGELE